LAPNPDNTPSDTLITAPGFPLKTLLSFGRDATSIAFLSTPGTERLYSGVANRTASAARNFSRSASQSRGGLGSRSWFVEGDFADLDDLQQERRRREFHQRVGHFARERFAAKTANEDSDLALICHQYLVGFAPLVILSSPSSRARRRLSVTCAPGDRRRTP